MIEKGDIPNTDPKENKNLNKFIRSGGSGERGLLLAVNENRDKGIIYDFYNERIILVREIDEDNYPKFSKTLLKIPKDFEYEDFGSVSKGLEAETDCRVNMFKVLLITKKVNTAFTAYKENNIKKDFEKWKKFVGR